MSISACMIVKDEEKLLGDCLASISDVADEIILVDTGSVDKTVEVAKKFSGNGYNGKFVFEKYKWDDDFSAARNYSMKKATGDWILVIDADEQIHKDDRKRLVDIVKDIGDDADIIALDLFNVNSKNEVGSRCPHLRLFRRDYSPEYNGRVHNRPLVRPGAKLLKTNCRLLHYGYDLPKSEMKKKFDRLLRMCKKFTEDEPLNNYSWFQYAKALKVSGADNMEVVGALDKALDIIPDNEQARNVYAQSECLMGKTKYLMGDTAGSLWHSEKALAIKPDYLDALYTAGLACVYGIDALKGEEYMLQYLDMQKRYQTSNNIESIVMEMYNARIEAYMVLIDVEKWKKEKGIM